MGDAAGREALEFSTVRGTGRPLRGGPEPHPGRPSYSTPGAQAWNVPEALESFPGGDQNQTPKVTPPGEGPSRS